jgi:hypothetical protein
MMNGKQSNIPSKFAMPSLIAFLCCLLVFIVLIAAADRLNRFGLLQQTYYLVLVLMGLAAAGFLFGVLQSSATWAGRFWGGTLRLSGPIVGAALVVVGGHYFIPKPASFSLTVYVHGEVGPQAIVLRNTGRVVLQLGPDTRTEPIGENGQAVFPSIPSDFRGRTVPGWVDSDDYEAPQSTVTIADNVVNLVVKRKINHFKLAGVISDEHGSPLPTVHVEMPKYDLETLTNGHGHFEFDVTADHEQMVDLIATKPGYRTVNLSSTLGDLGVNFSLKGPVNAAR